VIAPGRCDKGSLSRGHPIDRSRDLNRVSTLAKAILDCRFEGMPAGVADAILMALALRRGAENDATTSEPTTKVRNRAARRHRLFAVRLHGRVNETP
jgi:hypothetical protein